MTRTKLVARRVLGALVAIGASALIADAPAGADATPDGADPLGCDERVFDPAGDLDASALTSVIASTEATLGADIRIRAEQNVDDGLDARKDQLVRQCPGWANGDELADHMVIVMFSPIEREASIFYGADLGPQLEDRWDPAVDAMIEEFPDYTNGVEAGLRALTRPAPTPVTTSDDDSESSAGSLGLWVVLLVVLIGGSVLYRVVRDERDGGGDGDWEGADASEGPSWSSRSRRRTSSFGSFGRSSRSRSSSSSSSSRRAGGGSRRAGGGTKKW